MKDITAIIPVRKGSQRVPNKNTRDFCGTTLLDIKLKALCSLSSYLKDIVVSTDCDHMINMAKSYGVKTHRRDDYFASSEATNSEFFNNLADSIDADYFMYSPVTCPMVKPETYLKCFNHFEKEDNVVTVDEVKHHMWWNNKPLNYNIRLSPNSQDLPNIYRINYAACLISKQDMLSYSNVVTENPFFITLDEIEAIDIDTPVDFKLAELLYNEF